MRFVDKSAEWNEKFTDKNLWKKIEKIHHFERYLSQIDKELKKTDVVSRIENFEFKTFIRTTFTTARQSTKPIVSLVVQIIILILFFMVILGQEKGEIKFKVTQEEAKVFATVQSYRKNLIVEEPVENNIWSASFPIIYAEDKKNEKGEKIGYFGVRGEAKQKDSKNPYNGSMTFLFHRTDTAIFNIGFEDRGYTEEVLDIRNFVELGQESSTCASFEVQIIGAIYNIEITDGCMFIKNLLDRWGSASSIFVPAVQPYYPEEAKGADLFGVYFHREQPCHFFAGFFNNKLIIHSIPLKKVTYKPSVESGVPNGKLDLISDYFDGTVQIQHNRYDTYQVKQAVQYYEEIDKFYPLKTNILDENTSMTIDEIKNLKLDMWLATANFKYDVTSKLCYIINTNSIILLTKNNVQFSVNGNNIKIVINLNPWTIFENLNPWTTNENKFLIFSGEKYGILIENDAKKCGILK